MTHATDPMSRLAAVAQAAVADVAASSLSLEVSPRDGDVDPATPLCGSVISLAGARSMSFAVSSTPEGCRRIAGAMLGMEPSDAEELSHDDVRDSVAEFVNIVAGAIKTQMVDDDPQLALGLPARLDGVYQAESHVEARHVAFDIGDVACVLTLMVDGDRAA